MHFAYASSASGTVFVAVNFVARSDHKPTSDCTRASQARLTCSYDSRSSFCKANAARVRSCPQFRNGGKSALGAGEPTVSFVAINTCLSRYLNVVTAKTLSREQHQLVMMPVGDDARSDN